MHHPTDRIAHTTAFVTPVVEHWLEQEMAQWVHSLKDRSDDPSHHERTLLPRSYISLPRVSDLEGIKSSFICIFKSIQQLLNTTTPPSTPPSTQSTTPHPTPPQRTVCTLMTISKNCKWLVRNKSKKLKYQVIFYLSIK